MKASDGANGFACVNIKYTVLLAPLGLAAQLLHPKALRIAYKIELGVYSNLQQLIKTSTFDTVD